MPWVAPRSCAIGVSRLTGMNSAAISSATHIVIEPTALHAARVGVAGEGIGECGIESMACFPVGKGFGLGRARHAATDPADAGAKSEGVGERCPVRVSEPCTLP